jgi:hypothetical protein
MPALFHDGGLRYLFFSNEGSRPFSLAAVMSPPHRTAEPLLRIR